MSGRFPLTVEQIDLLLKRQMERLAMTLAPKGERRGHEWVALNPTRADSRLGSFSINLHSGVWKDFAAGRSCKILHAVALIAYLATNDDFGAAVVWAKRWLGLDGGKAPDPVVLRQCEAAGKKKQEEAASERLKKRNIAHRLFLEALPLTGACPASRYLMGRGIIPEGLEGGVFPRSLRFHPALTHRLHPGEKFPGLVACQSLEGCGRNGFGGIHRIYLQQVASVWVKFGRKEAKIGLGYAPGATIRIARGYSGKAMADAPAGEWVHACEGVEDALSLALLMPAARVVAAYSLAALGQMRFPETIGGVLVMGDNDASGSEAERALETACLDLAERYEVKVAHLPQAFKDVNDVLLNKRRDWHSRQASA